MQKKRPIQIARVATALLLVVLLCSGKDSCNSDGIYKQALGMLKNYSLIKDYRVYLKKKKKSDPVEFAYFPITLNRDVKYKFYCLSSPEYKGKLVLTLYNSMKREFTVATTYNPATKTAHESIEFMSHSTGNFCIGFYFLEGEEGCGVGVSSFISN